LAADPAVERRFAVNDTIFSDLSYAAFTFAHVVKEKTSGCVVMEETACLAAVNESGKVKRLDKAMVAILQSSPIRSH